MTEVKVAIIMGSDSDLPVMEEAAHILEHFEVPFSMHVLSAHRTPVQLEQHLDLLQSHGVKIFICGAGAAAHLAGAVSARVIWPVIGVPLEGSALKGIDALLATVQMPGGVPVATMAVGKAGATNAGILAVQILAAAGDDNLTKKLIGQRQQKKTGIEQKNTDIQKKCPQKFRFFRSITC